MEPRLYFKKRLTGFVNNVETELGMGYCNFRPW